MNIFAILSVARQVQGEYVCIKAEKAFLTATKAEEHANKLSKQFAETISTPVGPIECVCERGVFELDVEE
jgi:hypothetical protein